MSGHKTHCCIVHGCKYGADDCPVVSREITQEYPCETCSMEYDDTKKFQSLVLPWSYYWMIGDFSTDAYSKKDKYMFFIRWIQQFDFKVAYKNKSWGFRWYQFIDEDITKLWNDLTLESKILVFLAGCRLADRSESSAEQSAGMDW